MPMVKFVGSTDAFPVTLVFVVTMVEVITVVVKVTFDDQFYATTTTGGITVSLVVF